MPPFITVQSNAYEVADKIQADVVELERVTTYAAKEIGRRMRLDFLRTTQQWEKRPEFETNVQINGGNVMLTVGTSDEIFTYVDRGTRPHTIVPLQPGGVLAFQWGGPGSYKAKTTPRVLKSAAGGPSGSMVFRKAVQHPGTQAREFSKMIKEKYDVEAVEIMRRYVEAWNK